MEKSVFSSEYAVLREVLRRTRKASGTSQQELAERLGVGQSLVSKWERGEARLDVVQLRSICKALKTTLPAFVDEYEHLLSRRGAR